MKKLALMAAVAAIALGPTLAQAKHEPVNATEQTAAPGHSYTVVERDMANDTIRYKTTTRKMQLTEEGEADFTGRYSLIDGRTLDVEGNSAYIASNDGARFFAPNSAYITQRGQTFFVDDGQVLRLENPPEVVYVDSDNLVN